MIILGTIAAIGLINIWLYRRIVNNSSTRLPTSVGKETAAQYLERKENDQRFGK